MNERPKSFLFGAEERLRDASQLWAFYALTVLLAYGFTMFNLLLVGDDWHELYANRMSEFTISIGRWVVPIIWGMNDNNFSPAFTIATVSVAYLLLGAACCICLGLVRRESWLIFVCILISFPFNAEPFAFKMGHLSFTFGTVLATVSGLLIIRGYEVLSIKQGLKATALGAGAIVAFVLSAATYQPLALLAPALVLVRLVGMLRERQESSSLLRSMALILGFSAIIFLLGFSLYMGSIRVMSWLSGIPLQATGPYAIADTFVQSWSEFIRQVSGGLVLWRDVLFHRQHLFPIFPKVSFLVMTCALIVVLAYGNGEAKYSQRPRTIITKDAITRVAILCVAIVLLFLIPLAQGMVRKIANYRYDNMIGIAVPYAMVFALLFDMTHEARSRRAIAALALTVIAIFVYEQNRASVTTFLLNRHDLAIANRILVRITGDQAFAPYAAKGEAAIVFYGEGSREVLPRPFSADQFTLGAIDGCGVFNCQLLRAEAAFGQLSESGMTYYVAVWPNLPANISTDERQRLEQRIKEAHPWPAPDAVIFGRDVITVVLRPAL
jgi:Glucosyl transferase GtrII